MSSILNLYSLLIKKIYLSGLLLTLFNAIVFSSFSQGEDYFESKFEKIESFNFQDQNKIIGEYLESGLNINEVNLSILWYFELLNTPGPEIYKDIFYKTSFSKDSLKSDSLFFLMRINLFDAEIEKAEDIYRQLQTKGNKYTHLGAKILSRYFLDTNPKKSLYYHRMFFKFSVEEFVNKKSSPAFYWRNVESYFRTLAINKKYDTIVIYCDSVLHYKSKNKKWLERKGEAQYFNGKYNGASLTYNELYQIDPKFEYVDRLLNSYLNLKDTLSINSFFTENINYKSERDINIRHLYYEYLNYFKLVDLKDSLIQDVLHKESGFYTTEVPSEALYYYSLFQYYNDQNNAAIKTLQQAIELVEASQGEPPYQSNTYPPGFYMVFEYYVTDGEAKMFESKYYNLMGWLYKVKNRKNKALKSYQKSVALYECNINSYYSMASIFEIRLLKKVDKAISCYEKIISCDPVVSELFPAKSSLAELYFYEKNQTQKAKTLITPYLSSGRLKKGDYELLSRIYEEEKEYTKSIQMLDKLIEMETEEVWIDYYQSRKNYLLELKTEQ